MQKFFRSLTLCALICAFTANAQLSSTIPDVLKTYAQNGGSFTPVNPLTVWYNGCDWTNNQTMSGGEANESTSLMLGNGRLGVMVNGDASRYLTINEKGLFQGGQNENGQNGYQGFATIYYSPSTENEKVDYNCIHQLDLSTGVYTEVGARKDDRRSEGKYEGLEWFVSYPDQVAVGHITASAAGLLNYSFQLNSTQGASVTATSSGGYAEASFSGSLSSGTGSIVSYAATMRIVPKNGTISVDGSKISVRGADEITIIISALTDYDSSTASCLTGQSLSQLSAATSSLVSQAASKGWVTLYANHVADHSGMFDRMTLTLDGQQNNLSTQLMLKGYQTSLTDAQKRMFENLVFAYGRYLEIASSRPYSSGKGIDSPSNLQGIWAKSGGMWNCDIHGNINVNMNYWPAEVTNLSETHLGLCNWVMNLSKSGFWHSLATRWYKGDDASSHITDGWSCYFASNPFGGGYDYNGKYNAAQAWYCHHLIQHYLYTQDAAYRNQMMPVLWNACKFWSQYLKKKTDGASYIFETQAEYSPEQGGTNDGTPHTQQMVDYLFKYTVEIATKYGLPSGATDAERAKFQDIYTHLDKGLHTYNQGGNLCLREDKYVDGRFGEQNHRHLSHLTCVYPLGQIHPGDDFFDAAKNTMIDRGDVGYGNTDRAVWTLGWKACNWAQARDPHAFDNYVYAFTEAGEVGLYPNLFSRNQTTQIDGNFGLTAAVAEMLLQSNRSEITAASPFAFIDVAPALPSAWTAGEVSGLKAQGNFEVSYKWDANGVSEITVTSKSSERIPFYVHYDALTTSDYGISAISGATKDTTTPTTLWDSQHVWCFTPTAAGASVTITRGATGNVEPDPVAEYLPYTQAVAPNVSGMKQIEKDGDAVLNIMFGASGPRYYTGSNFAEGVMAWTIQGSDATLPVDASNCTGYAAASDASSFPYTECDGTISASSASRLFLTPIAGDFLRLEPLYSGTVTLYLRHSGTLCVLDEDGKNVNVTTTGSTVKCHKISVKGGKTYYVGVPSEKISFVAADFSDKVSYSGADYVIDGENTNNTWPTEGSTVSFRLDRAFTAGNWYPIVLPFSVSESMLRTIFGSDVAVLYLDPYENTLEDNSRAYLSALHPAINAGNLRFTRHYYQMLYANAPAFIRPSVSVSSPRFANVTFEGAAVKAYDIDASRSFQITGSYAATTASQNGEIYYLSNDATLGTTLYHAATGIAMRPTRVWIHRVGVNPAPQLLTVDFQSFDADDIMLGINDIVADDYSQGNSGDDVIYNILGMPMGTDISILPSGIYLHQGKKLYIK